ncbi:hypothetical protein DOO78_24550 [Roseicella frigidaeris]|uniref:DUF2946 domain-containing protein n=1 Tax=Roseicella frigidaeris TaxID=2230885 RepID=A0A327LYN3_9PROT|nr:hypothetical protein DOO78_24550 [Roseicella frigidaeris]
MGRAAGLVRLMLAAVFLLGRMALGFAAGIQPCPAAMHVQTVTHNGAGHAAAASPSKGMADAPCRPDHVMPCCCGPGLCGTALAVLPSATQLGPHAAFTVAFTPGPASAAAGIRASPALPPPRI